MALFRPPPTGNTNGHAHYVEMRAGKMYRDGTWLYPDRRKGSIFIYRNSEDLMHFCWRDRTTLSVEDNFIVFPGDCTYFRIEQCKTGRVYVLKFLNSNVRMFYWLQEPKTDKDDEHCRRINYYLNHTPIPNHNTPFNVTQEQLSRIFGPEVAAQLSILMESEENSRFVERTNLNDRKTLEPITKHDTTPLSESGISTDEKYPDPRSSSKKKSSIIITDVAECSGVKERRKSKNVTIAENSKVGNNEQINQKTKKQQKKSSGKQDSKTSDDEENENAKDEDSA